MPEILLLDDDPLQLKMLARTLNGLGYTRLLGCNSAAAALHVLNAPERQIGLILLDLNMPGVDGVAFLKLLSERRADIPVVLVSGEDERLVETAARFAASQNLSILGTVPKPVWPAELRIVLDRWKSRTPPVPTAKVYSAEEVAGAILHGELAAYFQPIVNLGNGELAGAETLVRWHHPRDGLVLPGQFVAIAEERGLIRDITRQMLHAAVTQGRRLARARQRGVRCRKRHDERPHARGPRRLRLRRARTQRAVAQDLVLEVSEQRYAQDPDAAFAALSRLRLRRITMAIDNFGHRLVLSRHLRDLPFNAVKVDRSFVHGAGSNTVLGAIVNSSIELARQLGMRTVAEGVEDVADWVTLRTSKCELAQGYFIGAPMGRGAIRRVAEADWNRRRKKLFPASTADAPGCVPGRHLAAPAAIPTRSWPAASS